MVFFIMIAFITMKKDNCVFFVFLFYVFLQCMPCFSQIKENATGGRFEKIIEFNIVGTHILIDTVTLNKELCIDYNMNSKSEYEKLLFGDKNATVEFIIEPSFGGVYGFRLLNNCIEAKFVKNYKEITDMLRKMYPTKDSSHRIRETITEEEFQEILRYNSNIYAERINKSFTLYRIGCVSRQTSDSFSKMLLDCIHNFIDNFRGVYSDGIVADGESCIFRCVVGDEVWKLRIHAPRGRAKDLVNICNRIYSDIKNQMFNEKEYIQELGKFIYE